jgi:hypothetical protein
MTTMRSVEPLTGIDALVAWLFPFLAGSEPELGEHGIDSRGLIYSWEPARGRVLLLDKMAPGSATEAEAG